MTRVRSWVSVLILDPRVLLKYLQVNTSCNEYNHRRTVESPYEEYKPLLEWKDQRKRPRSVCTLDLRWLVYETTFVVQTKDHVFNLCRLISQLQHYHRRLRRGSLVKLSCQHPYKDLQIGEWTKRSRILLKCLRKIVCERDVLIGLSRRQWT